MEKSWSKKKKLNNNKHNIVQLDKTFDSATAAAAEQKIQDLVILNSWRQQREKNKQLEADIKSITAHAESLQHQIYALRQLLDAEKTRVVHVNNDLRKILNALEECNREKQLLIKEKDQLEVRVNLTEEKLLGVENECKNLKNELMTAKNEARTWEKQLEKEREKINKMKDERKFFIDEVRFKGNLLVWQIRNFDHFSRILNILQSKPINPALPWEETITRIEPNFEIFRKQEKNLNQRSVVIIEKPLRTPGLKALLAKAEKKIAEEHGKTEELEKSILEKTVETSEIPWNFIKTRNILCIFEDITDGFCS